MVIQIDGKNLMTNDGMEIPRENSNVELSEGSDNHTQESRLIVEKIVNKGNMVRNATTGFGFLSDISITKENAERLQINPIESHSCDVGETLSEEIVNMVEGVS